nr:uncharacterized protein LOC117987734 [Maniola hyperantus]
MNFSIFLILSGIIRLVFSTRGNNTEHDLCNVCTLSLFRRKRANTEYTRWRANPETKQEFIVKVLEDDIIPTSETNQIAAVNIQPLTKAQEKIIIRGALIPTKDSPFDMFKEYTRFVPPTTAAGVTRIDGNIALAPVKPIIHTSVPPYGAEIKYGHDRNAQRAVNPPLSPQSQTLVTRQYAPIAPVLFTRRNTMSALTPRAIDKFMLQKTTARPTRTSPYLGLVPIRTSELVIFLPFNKVSVSRTTFMSTDLTRTSLKDDVKFDEKQFRKSNFNNTVQSIKNIDNETDTSYNDLFYNDENNERTTKKWQQSSKDNYNYNNQNQDDYNHLDKGFNSTEKANELDESKKASNIEQSTINYEDNDYNDTVNISVSLTGQKSSATVPKTKISKTLENDQNNRNLNCTVLKLRQLSFSSPLTLHEIEAQLKQWAGVSPVAKWLDITKGNFTVMENPIYMVIVDDLSSGQIISAKKTVMIVAGIQGRDHHAVTAAMYVLYQLIERTDAHSDLLSKFRFWIIPVFNPDGYDYSMTFPNRRQWSKNLRQTWDSCKGRDSCQACEEFGIRCTIQPCYGVNLDRNFEYQWIPAEELRLEHPCGNLYAGPRQLSEAETLALTQFLHEQRTPLYTFIAFKEGDVLGVMYPYSHTRKKRAFDHVYRQRASQAASAAYSISGRPYVAGQTSEFLPLYAGGIEDWVDGHLGIDNTYTVMLFRPSDAHDSKLVTERVVHEAYAAVDTLLLQSFQGTLGPPVITLTRASGMPLIPSSTTLISVILIILEYG